MAVMAKKRVRAGYNVNVYLDSELGKVIDRFLREHRPKTDKTGLTEAALIKFLGDCGYWPPPPSSPATIED